MAKYRVLVFAVLVVLAIISVESKKKHAPSKTDWATYKSFHKKGYRSDRHETESQKIFNLNKAKVAEHNKLFREGKVKHRKELNKFADVAPKEFSKRNTGRLPGNAEQTAKRLNRKYERWLKRNGAQHPLALAGPTESLPKSFTWTNKDGKSYVTPIRTQGDCGSCWSFASLAAIESAALIKGYGTFDLSEAQLVECTGVMLNMTGYNGCNGLDPGSACVYLQLAGIQIEESYSYTLQHTRTAGQCKANKDKFFWKPIAIYNAKYDATDEDLMNLIFNKGPVSVLLNADGVQMHSEGVVHNSNRNINHWVLLVGWGTDPVGGDYWLLKNSWGEDWGEHGFIKMSRTKGQNGNLHKFPVWVEISEPPLPTQTPTPTPAPTPSKASEEYSFEYQNY